MTLTMDLHATAVTEVSNYSRLVGTTYTVVGTRNSVYVLTAGPTGLLLEQAGGESLYDLFEACPVLEHWLPVVDMAPIAVGVSMRLRVKGSQGAEWMTTSPVTAVTVI